MLQIDIILRYFSAYLTSYVVKALKHFVPKLNSIMRKIVLALFNSYCSRLKNFLSIRIALKCSACSRDYKRVVFLRSFFSIFVLLIVLALLEKSHKILAMFALIIYVKPKVHSEFSNKIANISN